MAVNPSGLSRLIPKLGRGGRAAPPRTGGAKRAGALGLGSGLLGGMLGGGSSAGSGGSDPNAAGRRIAPGGLAGAAAGAMSGSGSLPSVRAANKPSVSQTTPINQLMVVAINYLASIDQTLKNQLEMERFTYTQGTQATREQAIEGMKPEGGSISEAISGFANTSIGSALLSTLAGAALLYSRQIADALSPVTDRLIDLGEGIRDNVPEDTGGILSSIENALTGLGGLLIPAGAAVAGVQAVRAVSASNAAFTPESVKGQYLSAADEAALASKGIVPRGIGYFDPNRVNPQTGRRGMMITKAEAFRLARSPSFAQAARTSLTSGLRGAKLPAFLGVGIEAADYAIGGREATASNLAESAGGIIGMLLGGALGATAGSLGGPVGTFVGGAAGGMAGDAVGRKIVRGIMDLFTDAEDDIVDAMDNERSRATPQTRRRRPRQETGRTARANVSGAQGDWTRDAAFISEVNRLAEKYGIDANDLLAVMNIETGGTMSPSIQNPNGGATGLIQFMPRTARGLGTTTDALKRMSRSEQMRYVEKYLDQYLPRNASAGQIYGSIFLPGRINRETLTSRGENYYAQNTVLDRNGDGRITQSDLSNLVRERRASMGLGTGSAQLAQSNVTTPNLDPNARAAGTPSPSSTNESVASSAAGAPSNNVSRNVPTMQDVPSPSMVDPTSDWLAYFGITPQPAYG